MNNDGSKRPSLVSATTRSTAPATGRILSDVEQTPKARTAKPHTAVATSARPRSFWWLSFAGIVLVLLVLGVWLFPQPSPLDSVPEAVIPVSAPAHAPADMPTAPGGAMIVDDTGAPPVANPLSRLDASEPDTAGAAPVPLQDAVPLGGAAGSESGIVSARRATSTAPARSSARGRNRDDDLMATLMKIIGDSDAPQTAARPESMDALIGDILASNARADQDTHDALAAIGGDNPPRSRRDAARATQAQRELSACPAVNTVEGLRCRDRVCARFVGLHPFCPRR